MLCHLHQDKKLREAFAVFTLVKFPALYPSGDVVLDYSLLVVYTHLVQRLLSGTLLRSSSPNINIGSDKDMWSIQNINPLPKFFKTVVICRRSLNVNYFIFYLFKGLATWSLTILQWVYEKYKLDLFSFLGIKHDRDVLCGIPK